MCGCDLGSDMENAGLKKNTFPMLILLVFTSRHSCHEHQESVDLMPNVEMDVIGL